VAATATSTVLSAALLPLNLLVYLRAAYGIGVGDLRWDFLLVSIAVVTTGVLTGICAARHLARVSLQLGGAEGRRRLAARRRRLELAGNVAGLCLIVFSLVFSSTKAPFWSRSLKFYASVATPACVALLASTLLASLPCVGLTKPERVAVSIECLYQNVGIGSSIAVSIFSGDEAADAAGTPLFYGACQLVLIAIYVSLAWKLGWTYAPAHDPLSRVLCESYQELADSACIERRGQDASPPATLGSQHAAAADPEGAGEHEGVTRLDGVVAPSPVHLSERSDELPDPEYER
jgi:predicted Na+-dependent transporter